MARFKYNVVDAKTGEVYGTHGSVAIAERAINRVYAVRHRGPFRVEIDTGIDSRHRYLLNRLYRVADESGEGSVVMTWEELALVNDPETMEELAALAEGESTILGMVDAVERVS